MPASDFELKPDKPGTGQLRGMIENRVGQVLQAGSKKMAAGIPFP